MPSHVFDDTSASVNADELFHAGRGSCSFGWPAKQRNGVLNS